MRAVPADARLKSGRQLPLVAFNFLATDINHSYIYPPPPTGTFASLIRGLNGGGARTWLNMPNGMTNCSQRDVLLKFAC